MHDKQTHRHTCRRTGIPTDQQTKACRDKTQKGKRDRHTDRPKDKTDRQTDIQTDGHADGQTDGRTNAHKSEVGSLLVRVGRRGREGGGVISKQAAPSNSIANLEGTYAGVQKQINRLGIGGQPAVIRGTRHRRKDMNCSRPPC